MQILQQQQALSGKSREALAKEKEKELREKAKHEEEKRKKEEAAMFKPIQTQKVPFGVDPKTVLCAFYKAGNCEKGNKCKFSHDLNVGRKVEKKNLYEDSREDKMQGTVVMTSNDRISDSHEICQIQWRTGTKRSYGTSFYRSMAILEQQQMCVGMHHRSDLCSTYVQIVCKFFIEAIETQKCVNLNFTNRPTNYVSLKVWMVLGMP